MIDVVTVDSYMSLFALFLPKLNAPMFNFIRQSACWVCFARNEKKKTRAYIKQ